MNGLELPITMFTQDHMILKIMMVMGLSMRITLMAKMMTTMVELMKIGRAEIQSQKLDSFKT